MFALKNGSYRVLLQTIKKKVNTHKKTNKIRINYVLQRIPVDTTNFYTNRLFSFMQH